MEWTLGRAVDVCLRAYSDHLLMLVGQCPPLIEMTGPDGTVVNLSSVHDVMSASFDATIREAASMVIHPVEVHRQAGEPLAGTRDSGLLGVLLAPFSSRPSLRTLISYLSAELKRREVQFASKAMAIEVDLHAPLAAQAQRNGQKLAYAGLAEVTKRYKRVAARPVLTR